MKDLFQEKEVDCFLSLLKCCKEISHFYGYGYIETPILEKLSLFTRSVGESSDIVSKEMYAFQDKNKELLCLRPEFTSSIVRMVIENSLSCDFPMKFFSFGPAFRRERPQKGRYRQFNQANFEIFGVSSCYADAELLIMLVDILNELSIHASQYKIFINSLGSKLTILKYKESLKEYLNSKRESLSALSLQRLDTNPLRVLDSKEPKDIDICKLAPKISDFYSEEDKVFFENYKDFLNKAGIDFEVNVNLVRGLDYYSSIIFEFVSLSNESGAQSSFIGGGRYDGLISDFTNGKLDFPASGCAIGVERLLSLLLENNFSNANKRKLAILTLDDCPKAYLIKILNIVKKSGFLFTVFPDGTLSKRLKKISKKNFDIAIIAGKDECSNEKVFIKNLSQSSQKLVDIENLLTLLQRSL